MGVLQGDTVDNYRGLFIPIFGRGAILLVDILSHFREVQNNLQIEEIPQIIVY